MWCCFAGQKPPVDIIMYIKCIVRVMMMLQDHAWFCLFCGGKECGKSTVFRCMFLWRRPFTHLYGAVCLSAEQQRLIKRINMRWNYGQENNRNIIYNLLVLMLLRQADLFCHLSRSGRGSKKSLKDALNKFHKNISARPKFTMEQQVNNLINGRRHIFCDAVLLRWTRYWETIAVLSICLRM